MVSLLDCSRTVLVKFIKYGNFAKDIVLHSDASLAGWGAVMGQISSGGRWLAKEATIHINTLELHAALLALKCFKASLANKHAKILVVHSDACHSIYGLQLPIY